MLSTCTYIQQIDSLQLFTIKLGQKGAAWAQTPTPCPPHPGGSMSATFSHPPLPSRSLVELYLVVCFSCGKERKCWWKGIGRLLMNKPEEEDKETESSEDRGESNENQVTKMFRWWREEKHLETKSFIIPVICLNHLLFTHAMDCPSLQVCNKPRQILWDPSRSRSTSPPLKTLPVSLPPPE